VQPKNAPAQTWFRGHPIVIAAPGRFIMESRFCRTGQEYHEIAGLQIGIPLGSARHVSIPAWGR
jgi:hypothetical protein